MTNKPYSDGPKRLLSNFLSLSGLQLFTYILPLITLPYLVRVLGVEKYGLVMFAQAFIMFFHVIVDYGFNLSATREIAVNRENKAKVAEVYSSVMLIRMLLLAASFLIFSGIVFYFDKFSQDVELYFLTFLIVVGQALFPIWYFQGMERMKYITMVNIATRVFFTLAIFIFVQSENDYLLVPLLNGLGVCLGGLYSLWLIKIKFGQSYALPTRHHLYTYFKDSSQFFLSRVAVSLYTSANAFILGLTTSNAMVGYYSIAEKLYQAVQSLYGPVTQALYPYVAKERNINLFKKIFSAVLVINVVGVVLVYLLGDYIFSILFTQDIGSESIEIFHIFLLANLVAVPSVMIGYPFLAALGYAGYANASVILAALYHLLGLGIFVFLDAITIYSVSMLFVSTVMVEFIIRVFGIRKYSLWKMD